MRPRVTRLLGKRTRWCMASACSSFATSSVEIPHRPEPWLGCDRHVAALIQKWDEQMCDRCGHARGGDLCPHGAARDEHAGRTRSPDWSTSIEGAISVSYRSGSQKQRLLVEYAKAGEGGLTDEEAMHAAGLSPTSCYWKRCNELRQDGWIIPTGAVRDGAAGVGRIVCRMRIEEMEGARGD